jgi:cytochrome c-type biogenesis protein
MEDVSLGLAFIAGLLSFVSPCCLPLVPAYIGYLGGRATQNIALETGSVQKTSKVALRANMLLHGLAFVLGFTFVFVMIGLMTTAFVSYVGSSVNVLTEIIGRVGGVIIIFFGLHIMGALRRLFKRVTKNIVTTIVMLIAVSILIVWAFVVPYIYLPLLAAFVLWLVLGGAFTQPEVFWTKAINRIQEALYSDTRPDMEQNNKGGLGSSFVMGIVFSAGWSPCIGPLLGTILTVAAQTGDVSQAVPLLTAYSLGLGIPFLLTAGLMEGAQALLRRLQRYMRKIELVSGSLLIVIGFLVASGSLQSLSANLSLEQAEVSYRIEECGIGFVRGSMNFSQAQACLGGNLHPVALGQSAVGELNATTTQNAYLINLHAPTTIDVELSRVENIFPATVVITDDTGNTIASDNELVQFDDTKYLIIQALELPAGRYTVTITQDSTEAVEFRLRVRQAEAIAGAVLPAVGSITDLADASGVAVGLDEGNRAPDFTVTTIDGEEITLSDLRGQVVLLNFWGTWCAPCRLEMPEFQQSYENHQDAGFTILALAVQGDTRAAVTQFRDDFGITFPLVVDEGDRINNMYGILVQPSTLILNEEGIIVYKRFGITTEAQIEEVLAGEFGG